ncbi:MAG: T9SS type A sorting domain-containing protein [Candidatus Marinimicrobia bacterium]|nr:T9SS type A sorting domain-containing protein [Candidatus Neomarinimicrobiota bacterium]
MKKLALFVWIIFSFLPLEAEIYSEQISSGMRDFLAIRVEFQEDNTYLTTGNGKFISNEWIGHDTIYVMDPLPHNRSYFQSHLNFINNYWSQASNGNINVNTDNTLLLPYGENTYTLSRSMRYYSDPDSLDYRLATLIYETVIMSVDSGDFLASNDGLIIYHAGAGQDFNIDLDDSPFDIPSFYFDETYLSEYLPYDKYSALMAVNCRHGVVLPESQNQLGYNIALNGTEILLTGMLLGLPTLYDTEFGRSGAGTYGLMDQGSNLGSGLCPIKPSAFERYLLGSADPVILNATQKLVLLRDEVYKLPITSNEYFLIEFRKNAGMWADSLLWARNNVNDYLDVLRVMDSLDFIDYTLENGVLTDISDQDLALPTNGLLIWHIIEPEFFGENPNGESAPFLNLVEADGGDDIGKWYGTFDPSVNNGWKWDMWFHNNPAYKDNNPASYKLQFNNNTHPNTRSKENLPSGINIRDFKFYADSVVIQLVMDPPADYNFAGMVFDEMTTAVSDVLPLTDQLIGYRDSSLYLFDGTVLSEVYKQDSAYVKGQVALLTYQNSLIQISNTVTSSKISHLVNVGGLVVFDDLSNMAIDHPIDLKHLAIHGDSLFLPPLPIEYPATTGMPPQPRDVYMLDIPSWTLNSVNETTETIIPYLKNNELLYISGSAAAVMNDTLIYAEEYGFSYEQGFAVIDGMADQFMSVYSDQHKFSEIIPLHMNDDDKYEILALSDFNGDRTLSAFTHYGSLLNNFPIFENYQKLRVYYLDGEPQILAYDPAGRIDVYSTHADLQYSLPAPVNASSLFLEQVSADSAWIVSDGSIYFIPSDSIYWGYEGKDAAYSNAQSGTQIAIPVVSSTLIKDGLIYNYPNPIENGVTKFRYFATGAQTLTINIYQLSGLFVQTLTDNAVNQQWNEVLWDVSTLESGVYIAKIDVTDGTKTETYFVKPAILK